MRTKHIYSVVINRPGYMPFPEASHFLTRREAEDWVRELVRFERYAGHTVTGSARSGFYRSSSGYVIKIAKGTAESLGEEIYARVLAYFLCYLTVI